MKTEGTSFTTSKFKCAAAIADPAYFSPSAKAVLGRPFQPPAVKALSGGGVRECPRPRLRAGPVRKPHAHGERHAWAHYASRVSTAPLTDLRGRSRWSLWAAPPPMHGFGR